MLVARIGDLPLNVLSRDEGLAFEIDAKPVAELACVGQCAPYTRSGRFDEYPSLDAVSRCVHMQPPGCILDGRRQTCNYLVALLLDWVCHIGLSLTFAYPPA